MTTNYIFTADWFDELADGNRPYLLYFYPETSEVQIQDVKAKRVHLRRTKVDHITLESLMPGSKVVIFGRQYTVTGYGNGATERALTTSRESTCALIKPAAFDHAGEIITAIEDAGLTIVNIRSALWTPAFIRQFYAEHVGKPFFSGLESAMTSEGPVIMLHLVGPNAISTWRRLAGPTNPNVARAEAPQSLRALYATDLTRNAVHGSDSPEAAARELGLVFGAAGNALPTSATAATDGSATLLVVKPHVIRNHQMGRIVSRVFAEGWDVSALQSFTLDRVDAEDFLEVYKGVYPQYARLVDEFASGMILAVEVVGEPGQIAGELRSWVGPFDPVVAQTLAPQSIRAEFGVDVVDNAVHCTDLPEDASLEVGFFFNLMQK